MYVNTMASLTNFFNCADCVFVVISTIMHSISNMLWTVFRRCEWPKLALSVESFVHIQYFQVVGVIGVNERVWVSS